MKSDLAIAEALFIHKFKPPINGPERILSWYVVFALPTVTYLFLRPFRLDLLLYSFNFDIDFIFQ